MTNPNSADYRSPYAKFDAHAHAEGNKSTYVWILDALHIKAVLNISYSNFASPEWIADYEAALRADTDRFPGRFAFCTSFNIVRFFEPTYIEEVLAKLEKDIDRKGAVAVKIWKDLGMMLRDHEGRYVFCDDDRLAPILDFIAGKGVPVVLHLGDPRAAWEPLVPGTPHYEYFHKNPEFHFHGKPDKPRYEEILFHRDVLVERYPCITFVCAHLASLEHDVERLGTFLDAHPNAMVDSSGRYPDLARQPQEKVRAFFRDYHDRILYGADWDIDENTFAGTEEEREAKIARTISAFRETFHFYEETLALPESVLEDFYLRNAAKVFG
jgi:predicted TIM-barrel fold metal-dependent hydrolase